MAAMSERKGQPPEVDEARGLSLVRQRRDARQERHENLRAVRPPDCAETQGGGDEVAGLGEDERLKAGAQRQTMPGRRGGDRDRIGAAAVRRGIEPPERLAIPCRVRGGDKRRPRAVVSRRRSAEAVRATASVSTSIKARQSEAEGARNAAENRMASDRGSNPCE